jgi:prepilin-type N-terminal cleavage/methylation domain-containing protein
MKCKKNSAGFTIVEMLMAMTIMAMLLTAIAVAFSASNSSYSDNEAIFRASNTMRQSLLRITTELRSAKDVTLGDSNSECTILKADDTWVNYNYNSDEKILYLMTGGENYVICKDVSAVSFVKTAMPDDASKPRNVQIKITVEINGITKTAVAGAAIRKNL